MSSEYNPQGLYDTVAQRVVDAQAIVERLMFLQGTLRVDPESGEYSDHAAQHAEERLAAVADQAWRLGTSLDYLAGRYTLTGKHRVEAERRAV